MDQTGVGGTAPRARACPGQLSAGRVFVRDSAATCTNSYGWALPWSVHGCIAPRRHSPNRRRSAVPGPRPVAPHAVPGGPGHLPRMPFTFPCAGGAYLPRWPPPRFTSVPQGQRVRGGCRAWATIASWRACAPATTPRSRSSTTATTAACSPSAGTCSAAARRPRTPCSTASPRPTARCAAAAGDIELRPWLYTIARNRCVSVHRAQRAQVSADGLAADFGSFDGHVGPGPAPRRPARAGGGAAAPARRPARGARPLRARRPVPRADRGGARGAPREGQGARLPGPRGADARARRARDSVRRDPRAARHRRRPRPAAQRAAPAHRPLSRLRGVRARGPPPARRVRGDPAPGADRRPEGLGAGLRARRRRRRRRAGRRGRRRRRDRRRGRRARGRRSRRAAAGSRGAPERPRRAPSARPARPAWPRAWPPAAAEWGWRACRPRASWRRSCPSWPWAAAARRRRSTTSRRRVRRVHQRATPPCA